MGRIGITNVASSSGEIEKSTTNIIGAYYQAQGIEWEVGTQTITIGWGTFTPTEIAIDYWFYSQDQQSGNVDFGTNVYGIKNGGDKVLLDSFTVGFNGGNGNGSKTITVNTAEKFVALRVERSSRWKHAQGTGYRFTVTKGKIYVSGS